MNNIHHGPRIFAGTPEGNEVVHAEDEIGPISVKRRGERRVLIFDSGLEQSSIYLNKPYYLDYGYNQAMLLSLLFNEAKDVTLLGLGGGSMAHCLYHYFKDMTINVVELRQAVIDIAYEFFKLPRDPRIQVHQSDAKNYMLNAEAASSDIIFSDLYEADCMAAMQSHQSFIESCYDTLTNSGCLVLNFHYKPEADYSLMHIVKTLFEEVRVCNVYNRNWILLCNKAPLLFDTKALDKRAAALTERVNMPLLYYYRELKLVE